MHIPDWLTVKNVGLLAISFFILMMESGIRQTMNVFAVDMERAFSCGSYTASMIVVVLPNASGLMTGPLASAFYNYFGARVTISVGSVLSAVGFLAAATLMSSIYYMILFSIIIGFGCGMMRNAIISVHFEYFPAKIRNTTLSFICIGPGIGIFLFPRIFKTVLQAWNWSSAFYGISTLYCLCAVMALFISKRPSRKKSICDIFGLAIWSQSGFIASEFAAFFASTTAMVYVSRTLVWMTNENVANPEFLYSYSGIASIAGRIILTVLLGLKVPVGVLMVLSYFVGQLAIPPAGICENELCFGVQNAAVGMGSGFYQTVLSPYLMNFLGPELLSSAFGFTNLVNGTAALLSIALTNSVMKLFNHRDAEFYFLLVLASLSILSGTLSYYLFARNARDQHRQKEAVESGEKSKEQKDHLLIFDSPSNTSRQPETDELKEAVREYIRRCTIDNPPVTIVDEYATDLRRMEESGVAGKEASED